jgi:predicted aspartyl protease
MIRYNYNRQINPPAPFVHVTIERPSSDRATIEIPAQIDSAADITVIPWRVVEELQLVQFGEQSVGGFGGYTLELPTFLIQIGLRGQPRLPVKVLASREETFALLGRDVLNHHHLVLDGPNLTLEVSP